VSETLIVLAAAFVSGFLDASVGGGGLVLVPALFAVFPATPHPQILGTSKFASTFGLGSAVWRYTRSVHIPWKVALPCAGTYFATALVGATIARMVPTATFRLLVPMMLAVMLLYVVTRRSFGLTHVPRELDSRARWLAAGLGALIGLYEGFFGPGSGALLIFAFVRVFGFDFLHAGAVARVVNFAGCFGAFLIFGSHGEVMWLLALSMAVTNIAGAWIGAHAAITRGSRFLRVLFLITASLLIAKTAWDGARPWLMP
jgi:hypothetical protein